jgi:tetratricopeptide (TPR) repeat protein
MNNMHIKITYLVLLITYYTFGQVAPEKDSLGDMRTSKNLTWEGNKELSENNFVEAEVDYRKAIAKSDKNVIAPFNLGNAYYNKETYGEAFGRFKQAGEIASDKTDKHKAFHNMGNVFMKRKEYEKAVEAYKQALRNDPKDEETRYNLALAKEMLKKDQEQKDQNKEDKKDQNEDKKDQNEDKKEGDNKEKKDEGDKGDQGDQKDENKEGEGDQKEEQKKQPDQGEKQEEQRPNQLSKQQIQNLLEAMQNEEKKVQEKMDAQKVKGVKVKNEKDW